MIPSAYLWNARPALWLIAALISIAPGCCAYGQQRDSAPAYRVIFEDDFLACPAGTFPARWFTYPSLMNIGYDEHNGAPPPDHAAVWMRNGEKIFLVDSWGANIPLAPNVGAPQYLPDSFNVDFDAITDTPRSDVVVIFYDDKGKFIFYSRIFGNNTTLSCFAAGDEMLRGTCPAWVQCGKWHRYRFEYRDAELTTFIDRQRVNSFPGFNARPASMAIAANTSVWGKTFVGFSNFRISTGRPGNQFSGLLAGRKFVTHAIHFDAARAVIKPSAYGFLHELAAWLKENPAVRLEIDGHTDDEGGAAANVKLSLARAAAVKELLTGDGIEGGRLTVKGFGATVPVKPNSTPEGREANRRVEFVRK